MRNAIPATKPRSERSRYLLAALLIVVMSSASVEAGIISFLGDVDFIAPPPSVVLGVLEDDQLTRVFLEQSALILGSDVDADVTSPGVVDEAADLTPGTIFSGTRVDSYLFPFDPASGSGASGGSVTFNRDILGILVQTSSLDAHRRAARRSRDDVSARRFSRSGRTRLCDCPRCHSQRHRHALCRFPHGWFRFLHHIAPR